MGRPRKKPQDRATYVVNVRLSKLESDALERLVAETQEKYPEVTITRAAVMRGLLRRALLPAEKKRGARK